jgi:hypothetical protein
VSAQLSGPGERQPVAHLVDVYNGAYRRRGRIGDYSTSSPTWQYNGVGTATLVVDEGGDNPGPVAQLLRNRTEVVPVVITDPPTGKRWTGRVAHSELEGPPGRGTITATLVDDYAWVRAMLGWPVPDADVQHQDVAYDLREGPVETVAKAYLQAAVDRLGVPLAVVPPPEDDTSPTVSFDPGARFTPLDELLQPQLRATMRRLTATLWLPGWDQPPGLMLSTPTVVLDVIPVRDALNVRWTDEAGILDRRLAITSPEAVQAVVGMKNTVTDDPVTRLLTSIAADDGRVASLGRFAFPEIFVNATDLDDVPAGQARGLEHLAKVAGTAGIAVDVLDGAPWTLGRHYDVGWKVRAQTSGVLVADTVERVTVTDNRAGRVITPQIGPSSLTESADALIAQQVAAITAAIASRDAQR